MLLWAKPIGVNVFNVGIMPNPAVAFLTKSIGANVGVVVSASHNMFRVMGLNSSVFGKKNFRIDGKKIQDSLKTMPSTLVNWGCKKNTRC